MIRRTIGSAARVRVAIAVVTALLAAVAFAGWRSTGGDERTVTAYFASTVNVHEGDEVRILGVPVGSVVEVDPSADGVKVVLRYDDRYRLADDASAAVVTPTLVSVRYIQLSPLAADGAAALDDGAVIPEERTATPLEWDQIKDQVDALAQVLGPRGGNDGALRRVLQVTADNVRGQGETMRASLRELAGAFDALSRGGSDLFTVIRNLGRFVTALQANDAQVALFNRRLATVAGVLGDNRQNLAALLRSLNASTAVVSDFIARNRSRIASTVVDLSAITRNLARSRQALADVLQRAPTAVSNLHNIYDPFTGAVTTSVAATNFNDPAQFLCGIAMGAAPEGPSSTQARRYCETALHPLLDLVRVPNAPVGANGIERDADNAPSPSPSGRAGGR